MTKNEGEEKASGFRLQEKPCRICKVVKAESELDRKGRCRSCAEIKAATDAGTTYGKFKGRQYAQEHMIGQAPAVITHRQRIMYCMNCGGVVPQDGKFENFCCTRCYNDWNRREKDARERGVFKDEKPDRHCPYCGKVLTGKKKYCNETCKYLANQDKIREQNQKYAAARRLKNPPPVRLCRYCGKAIDDARRKYYCSDTCAHEMHILQKRNRRLMLKSDE